MPSLAVRAEPGRAPLASTDTAETRERIHREDVQAWAVAAEHPAAEEGHREAVEEERTVAGVINPAHFLGMRL